MAPKAEAPGGEDAFALTELVMVVVMIGILSAIAIPLLVDQYLSARIAAIESDLRNAAVRMEGAAQDGEYPATVPPEPGSDDVTVTRGDSSGSDQFCLVGAHAGVEDGTSVRWYDSDGGGLVETVPATC